MPFPFQKHPQQPDITDTAWRVAGQLVGWLGITLLSVIGSGVWKISYQFPMILDRLEKRIEQVDLDGKERDAQLLEQLRDLRSQHDRQEGRQ